MSKHLQSSQHKRLMHVFYLSNYFKYFYIDLDVSCLIQYYCQVHKQILKQVLLI